MIECNKHNLDQINYFLNLMGQPQISLDSFSPFIHYVLIKNIAFISFSIYYDRAEINYLYVIDNFRRNGYASKLLEYVIKKTKNLTNITLEVNVNNLSAINLYKKFDFEIVAIREKYYGNDDAYLMIRR